MKTKARNLLLAILCLLIFAGMGFFYYTHWVIQRPFAVILFLTPSLNSTTLTATRMYAAGADGRLAMEALPNLALLRSSGHDSAVALPWAAASTMATGERGQSRQLSSSPDGVALPTLLDIARSQGRAVGLVTNGNVLSPSLAAFYAPGASPFDLDQIGVALLENGRPDVLLGGGLVGLQPDIQRGTRTDGRDLMLEARQSGFDIVRNRDELRNTPTWRAPRVFGIFSREEIPPSNQSEFEDAEPSLANLVSAAIQFLQFQRQGYFLVVDCDRVRLAADSNNGELLLQEMMEVDKAVQAALNYAGPDILLLVAGTAAPGGFQLNGTGARGDRGLAVLGSSSEGIPAVTWATGPGAVDSSAPPEPVAFPFQRAVPVAGDLFGLSTGEAALGFSGWRDSREVFQLIRDNL